MTHLGRQMLLVALVLQSCHRDQPKQQAEATEAPQVATAEPTEDAPPEPAKIPLEEPVTVCDSPSDQQVTVKLTQSLETLAKLFPVKGDHQAPYNAQNRAGKKPVSVIPETLVGSIEHFLKASLERDGFENANVSFDDKARTLTLQGRGCSLEDYETQLPRFLSVGEKGLVAWNRCVQEGVCGENDEAHTCGKDAENPECQKPKAERKKGTQCRVCAPWVYYLPLGLPLVNHSIVSLLDYPPADALCGADYLSNFTMNRVKAVFGWLEVDSDGFEALVDVHPISASGTGESFAITKATTYFRDYDVALLEVLATPPNLSKRAGNFEGRTLPVLVSGTPAQKAWQAIIEASARPGEAPEVKTGSMQSSKSLSDTKETAWVAVDHPNVTSYQCCPGDPTCSSGEYGTSDKLVENEKRDLYLYCMIKAATLDPQNPLAYEDACEAWIAGMKEQRCVQARQDYSFSSKEAHCGCKDAAEAFCKAHGNDACPGQNEVVSCADATKTCPKSSGLFNFIRCERLRE